jgi:hypothetical protein
VSVDAVAAVADAYADVAVANVRREYPNLLHAVLEGPADVVEPHVAHPAFHGSLDWHSCVEMVWVLARLSRVVPKIARRDDVRAVLDETLRPEKLAAEAAFFAAERNRTVERPYGWGWALMLADELEATPHGEAFAPLADVLVARFLEWLPKQTYPVRVGMHGNSAFGLVLALPYARSHAPELVTAVDAAARRWFLADERYPASWEPSGTDFLSAALCEAVLMQELLSDHEFAAWLEQFLPGLPEPFVPVEVSDPSDGQLAHLHGLNLNRAWALRRLGFRDAAERHAALSLAHVTDDDYMVTHWLAAFALLYLS